MAPVVGVPLYATDGSMTFLELCQQVANDCGVTEEGPTTVENQTGEMGRIVSWTARAWMLIQAKHRDWGFKRTTAQWNTINGQALYSLADCGITTGTFGMWDRQTFRNYVTAVGLDSEVFMDWQDYDIWKNNYLYGALRNTRTRPMVATIAPDKSIGLGPVPDGLYTVTCDYFRAPINMRLDNDLPDGLPGQFHMIIVHRAKMSYGAYESAPEVYQEGKLEYDKLMDQLEADRLPEIVIPGALC